jgi:hypothetical protein
VFLVLVVAALALALARRRGLERLARLHVRAARLLVVAAALQVGTALLAPGSAPLRAVTMAVTALLVALFLWGNRSVTGVPLMALGLLLNTLVVLANLAMPVSVSAAARAGLSRADLRLDADPLHEASGPGTQLAPLGDVVPVALPLWPQVVSPGDVLVASGVGLLLVAGAAPRRKRPAAAQKRADRPMVLASESTTRGSYS